MELLDLIETKKKELAEVSEKKAELENELSDLEAELEKETRKREVPKLNNPSSCLNPLIFISRNCPSCSFYEGCQYSRKLDYSILKNLHVTQTKRGREDVENTSEDDSTT